MNDYMIRATAANNQLRVFACTTRETVEAARAAHNTSPVATAALGRLLTAGVMMGSMMKNEDDLITLQLRGDGPLGGITVTADNAGRVKGYVHNPDVLIPANSKGKLDVAGAVGHGMLSVIRDTGLKEPYVGQIDLVSGEIAEDITYYYAASEQIPSSVGLGVLMNFNNTVRQAGGFIIQLMPFAEDSLIDTLEERLAAVTSVTSMLDSGMSPEDMITELLGGLGDIEFTDRLPLQFYCNCSKDRISKALISIGKKDLQEMIDDGKDIEVKCHFCNTAYTFSVEDLRKLRDGAR
jgi:molecular chaperone Hsp33